VTAYRTYRVEPPLPEQQIGLELILVMGYRRGNAFAAQHGSVVALTVRERDAADVARLLRKQRRALVAGAA